MNPLDFLAEVLPSPGHGAYCVAGFSKSRKEHFYTTTLSAGKPRIKEWLLKQRDVYFAMGTFKESLMDTADADGRFWKGRTADNVTYLKSMFVDLDGYESRKAAVMALAAFLEKTGLDQFGTPWVVGSGGGVHCYWPLTEEVDVVTWKPVAENFKRLFKQEGMRIDESVTADAARVLRIPGTMNFKAKYETPRPVSVLMHGDVKMDLRRFGAVVRSLLTAAFSPVSNEFVTTSVKIDGVRPSKANDKRSAASEALLRNSVTSFAPIWLKTEKGTGCGQLKHYIDNAQDDGMEPLWRALLSWTKPCADGGEYSVKLSEMHPYERERMMAKLAEIKGPYACVKLDELNSGVCPKCPHWGKITNPLALGRELITDDEEQLVLVPVTLDTGVTPVLENPNITADEPEELDEDVGPVGQRFRSIKRMRPPQGFHYGEKGGVFRKITEKDAAGTRIEATVPVLTYDLYVADMLRMDEKDHYVHMMAVKPIGKLEDGPDLRERIYTPIIMPMRSVVARDDLLKCLAQHNVLATIGRSNDENLVDYVRGAVDYASNMLKPVDVPAQFGWQRDGSFVYSNRIFKPNGDEVVIPMPGLENLNSITASKGTLEGWRPFWELLKRRKLYTMLAFCLDSFASPLMCFSEYEGFTWHIGSTESGTGKSLALSAKAAVWGHPIYYRTGKSTSPVAMQQRAGLLNNLPLLIDEMTDKARNTPEWIPAMIFDIAEGKGKERMESGANKERRNDSTWALTCTMTSNTHLTDILTGGRTHSSEGEVMRMLEWTPTKRLEWDAEERVVLRMMRQNYGVAGEAWVRWITQNRETVIRIYNGVADKMRQEIGFVDEERYWHAGCTGIIAAAVLLGPKYANLLEVPVRELVAALQQIVVNAREVHEKSHRTADDVLNAYTRDNYGKFVVIKRDPTGGIAHNMGADFTGKTSTRNVVMGRIEQEMRDGIVEYFIEEKLLKMHCAAMSFGYADFKRQLVEKAKRITTAGGLYQVTFGTKKDLLARTDGPSLRVTAMHLTISKSEMEGVMKNAD